MAVVRKQSRKWHERLKVQRIEHPAKTTPQCSSLAGLIASDAERNVGARFMYALVVSLAALLLGNTSQGLLRLILHLAVCDPSSHLVYLV